MTLKCAHFLPMAYDLSMDDIKYENGDYKLYINGKYVMDIWDGIHIRLNGEAGEFRILDGGKWLIKSESQIGQCPLSGVKRTFGYEA